MINVFRCYKLQNEVFWPASAILLMIHKWNTGLGYNFLYDDVEHVNIATNSGKSNYCICLEGLAQYVGHNKHCLVRTQHSMISSLFQLYALVDGEYVQKLCVFLYPGNPTNIMKFIKLSTLRGSQYNLVALELMSQACDIVSKVEVFHRHFECNRSCCALASC